MAPKTTRAISYATAAVLLALALAAPPAYAQASPTTVDNQTATGDKPFASFMAADIDQVQINSGALDVRIPLVFRKGRGENLEQYWFYSNKAWTTQSVLLQPHRYHRFWTTLKQQQLTFTTSQNTCDGFSYYNIYTNFIYTDRYNTKHPFEGQVLGEVSTCGDYIQLFGHSLDATGMTMDLTNFNPADTFVRMVREKDGTQVTNVIPREDSNGNELATVPNNGQNETDLAAGTGETLRIVSGQQPDGTPYVNYIFNASDGSQQTTQVLLTSAPVQTNFGVTGFDEYTGTVRGLAKTIILPNGLSYQFTYDTATGPGHYGELLRIDLPTGGYIRYEYVTLPALTLSSRAVSKRVVCVDGNPANEKAWIYSGQQANPTVTDPDGNNTVYTFGFAGLNDSLYETSRQYYAGSVAPANLLKTVQTDYTIANDPNGNWGGADVTPIRVTTTLSNGLVTKVETDYDQAPDGFGRIGGSRANPSERREYAYGSGAPGGLVRRTDYTYLHDSSSSYANANIVGLVSTEVVHDGNSNTVAQTSYSYDTTPITGTSSAVQHDYTNFSPSNTVRGNQTAVSRWLNTTGTWLTTTNWRDDLGNVLHSQDPGGHNTYFDYTDAWQNPTCPPSGGTSQAFVTKITNALGQFTQNSYYSCSSLLGSTTDLNSQITSFTYDMMDRPLVTTYPDGGRLSRDWTDTAGALQVRFRTLQFGSQEIGHQTHFDGLGRVWRTELCEDGIQCVSTIKTDTTYDNLGRKYTVTNPYRTTSDSTYGLTTFNYDALSRVIQVTSPDGGLVKTAYCGNATTVTDQAGKWRRSIADAQGRLTEVDEPNSPTASVGNCPAQGDPIIVTSYSYDTLNNLTGVVQNGSRNRSFVYDSVSRLTSAANPESGALSYTYDPDGNLLTKTDGRAITTTSSYDSLHRLTRKTYSDTTHFVSYWFDGTAPTDCSPALTLAYPTGRRTGMCDGAGMEAWSYDNMGRVSTDQRTTNAVIKTTSYTYNLDGTLATLVYPSARTVALRYDPAGRSVSEVDSASAINYALSATYAPQGALANVVFGQATGFAGFTLAQTFSPRLQPAAITAASPTSTLMSFSYNFNLGVADNGNVISITNNLNTARTQTFSYDQLNRILTGQTQATTGQYCWGQNFGYDPWANLLSMSGASGYGQCTQGLLGISVDSANRISGFCYDAAGNLLVQGGCPGGPPYTYNYNAENQMTSTAGVTYTYDGDGRRVQKSSGKLYWYGMGDEVLDESDLSGNITDEYVFFGGKRIAHRDSAGNIFYYFEDHLSTSRIMVQAGQSTACYDADFLPFGAERVYVNTCPQNYKFTGKERDSESGLDNFGARHYSSGLARFMSPDQFPGGPLDLFGHEPTSGALPYADIDNPQSLNKYAYTYNNPLRYIDPDGHAPDDPTVVDEIIQATKEEIDTVVKPLVESAVEKGGSALSGAFGGAAGVLGAILLSPQGLNKGEKEMLEKRDANLKHQQQQQQARPPDPQAAKDHTKGARPSTEEKHEEGKSRKKRDAGGEKGDERRKQKGMWPRRPPGGKQPEGGWPPKDKDTTWLLPFLPSEVCAYV